MRILAGSDVTTALMDDGGLVLLAGVAMSTPMAAAPLARPPLSAVLEAACLGLLIRIALRALRFDRVTTVVRWLARRTHGLATPEQVSQTLLAVDAGTKLVPVRIACLERSLTTVLVLALRRCGVTWQFGVRTLPLATHAWLIDGDGRPIGEPSTTVAYRHLRAKAVCATPPPVDRYHSGTSHTASTTYAETFGSGAQPRPIPVGTS